MDWMEIKGACRRRKLRRQAISKNSRVDKLEEALYDKESERRLKLIELEREQRNHE